MRRSRSPRAGAPRRAAATIVVKPAPDHRRVDDLDGRRPEAATEAAPAVLPAAAGRRARKRADRASSPVIRWRGQTAAWIARSSAGVTLLSFDQKLLELHLHSGTIDAGTLGWRYGPSIAGAELGHLAAAFNGGFKLDVGAGGFESYGRVGAPLQRRPRLDRHLLGRIDRHRQLAPGGAGAGQAGRLGPPEPAPC